MKYHWKNIGTLRIRFCRMKGADAAIVRFESDLCKAPRFRLSSGFFRSRIHLHQGTPKTPTAAKSEPATRKEPL